MRSFQKCQALSQNHGLTLKCLVTFGGQGSAPSVVIGIANLLCEWAASWSLFRVVPYVFRACWVSAQRAVQQYFAFLRSHVGQVEVGVISRLEFRAEGACVGTRATEACWALPLWLAGGLAFVRQPRWAALRHRWRLASITRHRELAAGILCAALCHALCPSPTRLAH